MGEYALVLCVSAAVTFLLTPIVRRIMTRLGWLKESGDRDIHKIPLPEFGGIGIYGGVVAGVLVAQRMPTLQRTFENSSLITGVLVGAGVLCLIGALDDKLKLDPLSLFAGDVVAAGIMVMLGVQLLVIYVPFGGVGSLTLGRDLAVPLTILVCAATINAVNFIDGMDGLAAGVCAIAALAFFVYSYHLGDIGYDVAFAPTLICAVTAGACIGFLPHNFSPARIFMGDSGARMLGLLLASVSVTATTADAQSFQGDFGSLPLLIPLVVPLTVLAIPIAELVSSVIRRTKAGRSPFAGDRQHTFHRLLEIGHSQRRVALLFYFWAAIVAFGGVAISLIDNLGLVLGMVGALAMIGLILVSVPRLRAQRRTHQ